MDVRSGFIDSIGNTPLIKLQRARPKRRAARSRQGRVPQPRRLGQGPRGAGHHRGRREAGQAPARRRHRRGHGGQHRHRPRAGRQRARLSLGHRDARDAEPGEEGHAAAVRRRPAPGAGRALRQSRQLRALLRRARRGAGARPSRTARSGPTSSTTSPTATATTAPTGPEIWEQTDGRVDGFTCSVGTGGTLAGVARALKERNPNVKIALSRSDGRGALQSGHARASSRPRATRSPRASARAASPPISKARRSTTAYQITDEEAFPLLFDLIEHEGLVPGRLDRHQHRRRHAARAAISAPARPSSPSWPTAASAISRKLFNPAFLREKNLPLPSWMK